LLTGEEENEKFVNLLLAEENVITRVDSNKFQLN
jgi:hypothetical protein